MAKAFYKYLWKRLLRFSCRPSFQSNLYVVFFSFWLRITVATGENHVEYLHFEMNRKTISGPPEKVLFTKSKRLQYLQAFWDE